MINDDCFHVVTNEDIFNEVISIRRMLTTQKTKIEVNTWIGSTALTLVVGVLVGSIF